MQDVVNPAIWRGTGGHNYWVGRDNLSNPIAIVDHCMGRNAAGQLGTLAGTDSYFRQPKSEVSAHFGIGKDGRTWQWVDVRNSAWANGIPQNPDLSIAWLKAALESKVRINTLTVSIEHEGDGIAPMPEPQYQATLKLHRFLILAYGIKPDRKHIIGHYQITGIDRQNCPGRSFPWERLMNDLTQVGPFQDPVTKITVNEPFATFWGFNGGLAIFGRPITTVETSPARFPDCIQVQYFERARLELHKDGKIYLGLVGAEVLALEGRL